MSAVTARTSMGFCPCGLLIEAGEQVLMRPTGAVHLGCERLTAQPPELPEFQLTPLLFEDPERAEDEETKATVGATRLPIHGETYSERRDRKRITRHLVAVFLLMRSGRYWTTAEIARAVGCSETTAAARCRQLRSIGHSVSKRWVKGDGGEPGYYEYRLEVNRALVGDLENQHDSRAA